MCVFFTSVWSVFFSEIDKKTWRNFTGCSSGFLLKSKYSFRHNDIGDMLIDKAIKIAVIEQRWCVKDKSLFGLKFETDGERICSKLCVKRGSRFLREITAAGFGTVSHRWECVQVRVHYQPIRSSRCLFWWRYANECTISTLEVKGDVRANLEKQFSQCCIIHELLGIMTF